MTAKNGVTLALVGFVLCVCCGCGKGGSSNPAETPVAELKVLMQKFARLSSATNYAYDVTKSDSLVSPYIGTVTYVYLAERANNPDDQLPDDEMTATFAYQEKKWVLKRLCENENYHQGKSGDTGVDSVFAGLHWCDDDEQTKDIKRFPKERDQWRTALTKK